MQHHLDPATLFALPQGSGASRAEVAAILDATDAWLRDRSGPGLFRRWRGESAAPARALLQGLTSLGVAGAFVPEPHGGSGLPLALGLLLAERFGWHLAREPFIESCLLPTALLRCLPQDERSAFMLAALAGGKAVALAFQEGAFGFDRIGADRSRTHVRRAGGLRNLSGEKCCVMGAAAADWLLVLASSDGAPCIVAVPGDAPGLSREDTVLADGSCWSTVRFDVALPDDALFCCGEQVAVALADSLDWANLAIAGLLYGLQCRMMQMTLEYLCSREQFGAPIGSFQALQHRVADLYCANQITRFLLAESVESLTLSGAGRPAGLAALASRCKARAADTTLQVGKEAIQMHGAIGFSDECDLGMYVNRALVLSAWLGNAVAHRRRFASMNLPLGD